MKIIIRQARIIDPLSPYNGQQLDLFIDNGIIRKIASLLDDEADTEISLEGLCVSPGWADVFSHFEDPGHEYKETLDTGAAAAASGGYTDVMIIPNTYPSLHNKSGIEYVVRKAASLPVRIHPIGAITRNTEGKELAEMYDMYASGAVSFGDGINTLQSSGVLLKALQYVKAIGVPVIQLPDDNTISPSGLMHEGVVSTRLGLPGKPAIAEELMVERDIRLAEYAESAIHFTGISSARSLELIRDARKKGIDVTCSVSPAHLYFTEDDLTAYDTNLKLNPPLRGKADREALRQALVDGTVDCIASHHLPHDYDNKVLEFENARYGMISLETAYSVVRTAVPDISAEQLVKLFSTNARKIFKLPPASIDTDKTANIVMYQPDLETEYKSFLSRSANSPFKGKTLKGKVGGIIRQDQLFLRN